MALLVVRAWLGGLATSIENSKVEHQYRRFRARYAAANHLAACALRFAKTMVMMLRLSARDVDHAGAADAFTARRFHFDADFRQRVDDRRGCIDTHGSAAACNPDLERVKAAFDIAGGHRRCEAFQMNRVLAQTS